MKGCDCVSSLYIIWGVAQGQEASTFWPDWFVCISCLCYLPRHFALRLLYIAIHHIQFRVQILQLKCQIMALWIIHCKQHRWVPRYGEANCHQGISQDDCHSWKSLQQNRPGRAMVIKLFCKEIDSTRRLACARAAPYIPALPHPSHQQLPDERWARKWWSIAGDIMWSRQKFARWQLRLSQWFPIFSSPSPLPAVSFLPWDQQQFPSVVTQPFMPQWWFILIIPIILLFLFWGPTDNHANLNGLKSRLVPHGRKPKRWRRLIYGCLDWLCVYQQALARTIHHFEGMHNNALNDTSPPIVFGRS